MDKVNHFFTVKEVSEKLRVSERTIYRLIESGKLKAVKISRKAYRISEKGLIDFLKKCRT